MGLNDERELELSLLFTKAYSEKWLMLSIVLIFTISALLISLFLPNTYQASVTLAPAANNESNALSKLAGQFGGVASLAGINLGSNLESDKSALALEVLVSRIFLEEFIDKHDLLIPLMASDGWNVKTKELSIDDDIYSLKEEKWVRDVSFPKSSKPSLWEAYEKFKELLTINKNEDSGVIKVSIEHYSPVLAKTWLALLISDINLKLRKDDQRDSEDNINFLKAQLENTSLSGMISVFYQLIEEQTKTLMLSHRREEYVFKVIDPSNVPEKKHGPRRVLIVIAGMLLGSIFSVCLLIIKLLKSKE